MNIDLENKYKLSLDNIDKLIEEKNRIGADYFILLAERSGSSPQFEGAYILINSETSDFIGTVGGGLIEYRVISLTKELAKYSLSAEVLYTLSNQKASDLGMVCGGKNLLYIMPTDNSGLFNKQAFAVDCGELNDRDYIINSIKFLDRSRQIVDLSTKDKEQSTKIYSEYSKDASQLFIYREGPSFVDTKSFTESLTDEEINKITHLNKSENMILGEKKVFVYLAENEPRVFLAGGGHVSRAVSKLLGDLGWNHTVLEDRADMLKQEFFSDKANLVLTDLTKLPSSLVFTENDYICIMTRGHAYDYTVLKQVIRTNARYIGVMGSKRKLLKVRAQLAEDGFTDEEINSIYSPIGLDIDAVSLVEIAISIVAELIAVHRKKIYKNDSSNVENRTFGSSLKSCVGAKLPINRK